MPHLLLSRWDTPATSYVEQEVGGFRIVRKAYEPGLYDNYGLGGFGLFEAVDSLPITVLEEYRDGEWHEWMVDDPPHWYAMQKYAEAVEGHVVVGGLGLGLVLHAMAKNTSVTKITVIERARDLLPLMLPLLPEDKRREIVVGDFSNVLGLLSAQSVHPDWFIVDIWTTRGVADKMRQLVSEVLPLDYNLRARFPKAKVIYHGFVTPSDYRLQ